MHCSTMVVRSYSHQEEAVGSIPAWGGSSSSVEERLMRDGSSSLSDATILFLIFGYLYLT